MWELDCEESWALKNWCFWTVVLQKTLESPLDCKEIQPLHSKGDQSWDFFGRNLAKAETPVLWPPHAKSWLIGNDSDAGRDWGQEGKGTTEDEMAGWHHQLNGRESEWTPGVGDGGLVKEAWRAAIHGVAKSRTCFFSVTGWGIDLDYCDIERFALEMNRDHSVIFEIASKYCISVSFCWLWGLLHFFWGSPARSSRYNGHLS